MKRAGLLGGMSWESSLEYYRILNEEVKNRLGGSHSADCLMYSFDFDMVEKLQHQGEWDKLTAVMVEEANNLKKAGADCICICTNTMHLMADDITESTRLPLIHIAEAAGTEINRREVSKVILLGTKFTMNSDFYRLKLEEKGIEVIIPDEADQKIIHDVIYHELILGKILDESRKKYISVINKLTEEKGAEGVVLACTEIPLLIKNDDVSIEVFDTTEIHARAIVDFMLTE